jgi:hypothetical protein
MSSVKNEPAAKRYKKREDTIVDSNDRIVMNARCLQRAIDKEQDIDEISRITTRLDEAFMRDHQFYYVVNIVVDSQTAVNVLLSSHAKKTKLEALLHNSVGIDNYATEAYIEDDDRKALLKAVHLDLICHLDNVDYWVDHLITEHDVFFNFVGTADTYLNDVSKLPAAAVSNLDMQFLRQLTTFMDTPKVMPLATHKQAVYGAMLRK